MLSIAALPAADFEHEHFLTFTRPVHYVRGFKAVFFRLKTISYIKNTMVEKRLFEGAGSLTVSDFQW